jgi:hypothetical protein
MANPGESNWQILNVGYGVLNPVGDTLTGKAYNKGDAGWFSMVRETAISQFSANSGANNGPLVGIVLRNEGKIDLTGPVDPTSWPAKYAQLTEKREGLALMQVRVRIPEIHAHLPVPKDLPPRDTPSEDHGIINLYPVFVGQFDSVDAGREPVHGSLVWVDFQNRATFQGPIYLGAVEGDKTYLPNYALETSGKFASICNKALNESVAAAGSGTGTGGGGGSGAGAGKPIVKSGGTPNTVAKVAKAAQAIFAATTIGKIVTVASGSPTVTKAANAVVATAKAAANKAVKIYCKRIEQLRGELQNIINRYPNVPFPLGTPTCNAEETRAAAEKGAKEIAKNAYWNKNWGPKTGENPAQKVKNAMIVYDTFVGNGFTPQAAMAALAHAQGESGYHSAIVGGISKKAKNGGYDENRRGADKGFFQLNNMFGLGSTASSLKLNESSCIDTATGNKYYDIIGKGKRAEIDPNKKDRKVNNKSAMPKDLWNDTYYDAGDPKTSAMVLIAHLKNNRGNNNRLGTLAALMKNPNVTSAQVHALFRNSPLAAGNNKKNQYNLKTRMNTGEKVFGKCYTGEGYLQNFQPGTTNKP